MKQSEIIELTKTCSEITEKPLESDLRLMEKNGYQIDFENYKVKRDAAINDAAYIVTESYKALTNNLSDNKSMID